MATFAFISAVEKGVMDAIDEETAKALEILGVTGSESPKVIVQKMCDYVDKFLKGKHKAEEKNDTAVSLGAAWGSAVVREYGWKWMTLGENEEDNSYYVVSPKDYYCCPPIYFLNKIIQGKNKGLDGKNDNTVMLLFNMLDGMDKEKPAEKYNVLT